jgi:hypothetical protein
MAQPQITVRDALNALQTINTISDAGREAAADSQSVAMSAEDKAVVDAIAASLAGTVKTVGILVPVAVEFNRPADTTAYAANDSVSDSTSAPTTLEFPNIVRENGGSGYLVRAVLVTNQPTNVSQFRLHLYTAAPTAGNDNAPFTLAFAQRASGLGFIDFDAMQTEGAGSDMAVAAWRQPLAILAAGGTRSIFAKLETKLGFTPANGQTFRIVLIVDQN